MYSSNKPKGRKSIPSHLLWKRREFVGLMKQAGLKTRSVQRNINQMAIAKGWGEVSERTIERDFQSFLSNQVTENGLEYWRAMRASHLAQMGKIVENLAIHIAEKTKNKSWAPLEHASTLSSLHRMQMRYAELQGWNLTKLRFDPSKMNTTQQSFTNMRLQRRQNELKHQEEKMVELGSELDTLLKKLDRNNNFVRAEEPKLNVGM